MKPINFFDTLIDKEAGSNVLSVLNTTFLSEGAVVKEFESSLEKNLNVENIVTVNSGTSALHLSLVLAGVGPGDEVILPPQTFIASGSTILMQQAKPIFCDINYDDGNINVEAIEDKITSKTKAIMVVHWAGLPCDMDKIKIIAERYNLAIIEDAAHAIGAEYKSSAIGSISDYTCFSFQAIKHLTTGDGGAIAIKNYNKYIEAKRKRWFGLDRENSQVSDLGERDCNVFELGYKYHLNDLVASLGLSNLKNLKQQLIKRREIAFLYDKNLKDVSSINLFKKDKYKNLNSNWLYGFHVEGRDNFIKYMKANNIPVSVVHQGIDKNNIFGGKDAALINQRRFDESQIHIPMHGSLSTEQTEFIIETIKKGW
jgi:perosamine synthetase